MVIIMAIKRILLLGNPLLREKSEPITSFDSTLQPLIQDLQETLRNFQQVHGIGRAIAAPQIGVLQQAIVMETKDRAITMINPEIVSGSKETFEVWDSCFSFNVAFFVKIKRHKTIKVNYLTPTGEEKTEEFHDDLSELFQHEIDHLHGILATDHLTDPKAIIMREHWEKHYRE
jgi:peptide deformylase